jgi:hypothetical protein
MVSPRSLLASVFLLGTLAPAHPFVAFSLEPRSIGSTEAAIRSTSSAASSAASALTGSMRRGTVDVGSTGADGTFNPTGASHVVDLAAQGTYDPQRWLVVFHYTSVNIPQGTTVTFLNHPSRAPVVWLVQSDVTIAGTISLDGQPGRNGGVAPTYAEPGPGGFRGGRGTLNGLTDDSSAGFGPGGGYLSAATNGAGSGGSYGTLGFGGQYNPLVGPIYGDPSLAQLVGGSGGAAGRYVVNGSAIAGGGGGGGAILIAANGTIAIAQTAVLSAAGGAGGVGPNSSGGVGDEAGGGSGGAVRLVADTVTIARGTPGAVVRASGGAGGAFGSSGGPGGSGRIRIEKNTPGGLSVATLPSATIVEGGVTGANLLPNVSTFPTLSILSVAGIGAPLDPRSPLGSGAAFPDVNLALGGSQTVELEGRNIPLAASIYLRATNANGQAIELAVSTTPLGTDTYWTRLVDVNFPSGYTALQARAVLP